MTQGLADTFADRDSTLHRLDPRAKIVALSLAVLIVASTPAGNVAAFAWYYGWTALLIAAGHIPIAHLFQRCAMASPFILMAAALPYVSLGIDAAWAGERLGVRELAGPAPLVVSVLLKAYAAVLLLTLLTATSRFNDLLWGLRRLHAPEVLHAVAMLMYRYLFLLHEEWQRAARARALRAPAGVRMSLVRLYGKQVASVFLRSWERADRVQAAMVVRGFTGILPLSHPRVFAGTDLLFAILTISAFLAARWPWIP